MALPGLPCCNLSVLWSLNEGTRGRGSCVSLLSLPSLIEHDDFHLFPSAHGGAAPIRPWDWLQSPEIARQMDIEQISANLSWERINRVKDGNLRVREGGGESGGQLVLLSSLLALLLSCACATMANESVSYRLISTEL